MENNIIDGGIYTTNATTLLVFNNNYVFAIPNELIINKMQTENLSNKLVHDFLKESKSEESFYFQQIFLEDIPISFLETGYLGKLSEKTIESLIEVWDKLLIALNK